MASAPYSTDSFGLTKRRRFEIMRQELANERASFERHWRDLSDFILPRRSRFTVTDTNRGDRRNNSIYDTTQSLAARTLRSGMMSGVTSPARPWFRLATPDQDLNEYGRVKDWLHVVSQRMAGVFSRSNLYTTLPILYGDMGVFGTGAMIVEESFDKVVRFKSFPIGRYSLAADFEGRVNVFSREYRMTVRNLVMEFGERNESGTYLWDNFSTFVKNAWDRSQYETWVDVAQMIAPNPDFNPKDPRAKCKPFASCTYEYAPSEAGAGQRQTDSKTEFLRESGYDYFPVLAPRWEVAAEDVYGTECPGMTALGDIRQLQTGEKKALQGIEKMVNPPMQGPSTLANVKASILPGDITYYDTPAGREGFRPVHEVQPRLQELEMKQQQVRERIDRAFFVDLFLMLSQSDRREITAREIDERHEEKLLALGPVLEQLNADLLDPLIDITFDMMNRQGLLPKPPDELQGMDLKVEYVSVMAQAQKLVGIAGIERSAQFALSIAPINPAIMDKYDWDQMAEEHGDAVGLSPKIIRTDDEVQQLRGARQQQEQAMQQAQMLEQGASAAKNLSGASLEGDNALGRVLDMAQAGAPTT